MNVGHTYTNTIAYLISEMIINKYIEANNHRQNWTANYDIKAIIVEETGCV